MIQIYHNSRCSKSRQCLSLLENSGKSFEVINYIKNAPSIDELKTLLNKLDIDPIQLVRQNEKIWKEHFADKKLSDAEIIIAMTDHPILIERPIVVNGSKAVIARPIENAVSII